MIVLNTVETIVPCRKVGSGRFLLYLGEIPEATKNLKHSLKVMPR